MAQWCNPRTLQREQSGGVDSIPGRASVLEGYCKMSRARLALSYICNPSAWCYESQLHIVVSMIILFVITFKRELPQAS